MRTLLTHFSHPGGVEIVTDLAGQDATTDYDDVGHTQEAHEILEKFVIGTFKVGASSTPSVPKKEEAPKAAAAPTSAPKPVVPKPVQVSQPKPKQASSEDDSSMMLFAGAALAAVAVGLMLYRRSMKA